jgi:hypothetical protein
MTAHLRRHTSLTRRRFARRPLPQAGEVKELRHERHLHRGDDLLLRERLGHEGGRVVPASLTATFVPSVTLI